MKKKEPLDVQSVQKDIQRGSGTKLYGKIKAQSEIPFIGILFDVTKLTIENSKREKNSTQSFLIFFTKQSHSAISLYAEFSF